MSRRLISFSHGACSIFGVAFGWYRCRTRSDWRILGHSSCLLIECCLSRFQLLSLWIGCGKWTMSNLGRGVPWLAWHSFLKIMRLSYAIILFLSLNSGIIPRFCICCYPNCLSHCAIELSSTRLWWSYWTCCFPVICRTCFARSIFGRCPCRRHLIVSGTLP